MWDEDLLEMPCQDSLPILSPVRTLSPALTEGDGLVVGAVVVACLDDAQFVLPALQDSGEDAEVTSLLRI